jgi:outer membrane protein, adhesin transport system
MQQQKKSFSSGAIAVAAAAMCAASAAQTTAPPAAAQVASNAALKQAVEKAIASNPELNARLNALRASGAAIDIAKGGWLPKIDLTAEAGTSRDRITSRTPQDESLSRTGVSLNLTQVLWDARLISSEINRAGHERGARWFEWLDATESTAVEAARAHFDVLRFRSLLTLSQENLSYHRTLGNQINSRVTAGVARGVDMEQVTARTALAETNVVTEAANLNDVTARYLRIVGERPPERIGKPAAMSSGMPATELDAVRDALQNNPAVSAAIENLRATRAANDGRKGALWQPRVEARLRAGGGRNFDGSLDQKREASAELNLNWNLFNGGSDQARVRQTAALLDQAADLRDKTCRDTRQVASIAFNEMQRYAEQVQMFNRNVEAIERAREAYRQQFDIGQRSLLDLLNTENELFSAKRARANAEHDMLIAQARVLAASQKLTSQVGLTRELPGDVQQPDNWNAGADAPGARCPVETAAGLSTRALLAAAPAASPRPTPTPAPAPVVAAPAPAPAPTPRAAAPAPAVVVDEASALSQRVRSWAAAWSAKDFNAYRSFYAGDFAPGRTRQNAWVEQRQRLVTKAGNINVDVSDIEVRKIDANTVETNFRQAYTSNNFKDTSSKSLLWKRQGSQWVIARESNR